MNGSTLKRRSGLAEVRVFPRLRSTHSKAADLVRQDEVTLPAAVIASRQSAGRGRGSNVWYSDAGSLTVTFVMPARHDRPATEVSLRAGLAVFDAISTWVSDDELKVKWPNDVLIGGKKVAGILCERVRAADVIGIGLNVTTDLSAAPNDVCRRGISLANYSAGVVTREDVFVALAIAMRGLWDSDDWLPRLRRYHFLTGRQVTIDVGNQCLYGQCRGIDDTGRLLIDDGRQLHAISSGHVI